MTTTLDKNVLHDVIDWLSPEDTSLVFRMLRSFVEDYHDSQWDEGEYEEHLAAIERVKNGEYVLLSDLPD